METKDFQKDTERQLIPAHIERIKEKLSRKYKINKELLMDDSHISGADYIVNLVKGNDSKNFFVDFKSDKWWKTGNIVIELAPVITQDLYLKNFEEPKSSTVRIFQSSEEHKKYCDFIRDVISDKIISKKGIGTKSNGGQDLLSYLFYYPENKEVHSHHLFYCGKIGKIMEKTWDTYVFTSTKSENSNSTWYSISALVPKNVLEECECP